MDEFFSKRIIYIISLSNHFGDKTVVLHKNQLFL